MILLYLPVFTSVSRPKKGKDKSLRQYTMTATTLYMTFSLAMIVEFQKYI